MLVSATPRTPASGLFFPRTHRCSAWLGAAALPLPSLGLLPARYDSGRPGFPVPAVAVRGESGQTSADTRADYAPCGPPARHAANFRLLLALLGAADHWQSCDNHLYNPAPGEILPRLVGVQPQMEDLGLDGGFGPKDIRLETEARLDMVKDDLCRCRYRLDGKLRA